MKKIIKKTLFSSLFCASIVCVRPFTSMAGTWKYDGQHWSNVEATGKVNTGWYTEGVDDWYYFDEAGKMVSGWYGDFHLHEVSDGHFGRMDYGWYYDGVNWYFLNTSHDGVFGAKVKGWQWIDGYCYYFAQDGKMLANTVTPDGYYVNDSGQWELNGVTQYISGKGWQSIHNHLHITEKNYNNSAKISNKSKEIEMAIIDKYVDNKEMKALICKAEGAKSENEKKEIRYAVNEYLNDGISSQEITSFDWHDDNNSVMVEYVNGALEWIILWEEYVDEMPVFGRMESGTGNYKIDVDNISIKKMETQTSLKNNKMGILTAFDRKDEYSYYGGSEEVNNYLNQETSFESNVIWNATIDDYKTIDQYGMILITTHGSLTSDGWKWWKGKTPVICVGQTVTKENIQKYLSDIEEKRIIKYTNDSGEKYAITPDFFRYYFDENNANKLDNTLVFIGMCYGSYNNKLSDAFLDSGSEAYMGYTDSVLCNYHNGIITHTIWHMVEGEKLSEALDMAEATYGIHDMEKFEVKEQGDVPAYPKISGNAEIGLYNKEYSDDVTFNTKTEKDGSVTITIGVN